MKIEFYFAVCIIDLAAVIRIKNYIYQRAINDLLNKMEQRMKFIGIFVSGKGVG